MVLLCFLFLFFVGQHSKQVSHWSVTLEDSQRWEPPDRDRYAEAKDEAPKELESNGAMIPYLLKR